jgi:ferric-dicitrate binding protein FerR (iron transport regulator)
MDDFIRPSNKPNRLQPNTTVPQGQSGVTPEQAGLEEGAGPSERPSLFNRDAQDRPQVPVVNAEQIAEDEAAAEAAAAGSSPAPVKKRRFARKHIVALSIIAVALLGSGIAYMLMSRSDTPAASDQDQVVTEKMTATSTVVEGTVEYKRGEEDWKELLENTELQKDDQIRTKDNSRAAIIFGEKSVIRLSGSTQVTIESLANERITIIDEAGIIYARVAQSKDRVFAINIDDELITAKGTAFKTFNIGDTAGVEVYHNEVEVQGSEVKQGESYYLASPDAAKKGKVTPIDIEQLKNDAFIAWCIGQDKDDDTYKDELGFLGDFDGPELTITSPKEGEVITVSGTSTIGAVNVSGKTEKNATVTVTVKNSGAQVNAAVDAVGGYDAGLVSGPIGKVTYEITARDANGNKTIKSVTVEYKVATAPTPTPTTSGGPVTIQSTSFVGGGIKVNWQVKEGADIAGGFRIVWDTDAAPTYPEDQSEYLGYDSRIYVIPADKVEDEKTYHIRVCVVTSGECTSANYSNEVTAVAPKE